MCLSNDLTFIIIFGIVLAKSLNSSTPNREPQFQQYGAESQGIYALVFGTVDFLRRIFILK